MQNRKREKRSDISDLTGMTFNYWTVLAYDEVKFVSGKSYWICECVCGEERSIRADQLKSGVSKSCGCHNREVKRKMMTTHGDSNTKLHKRWVAMRQRCSNPKNSRYHNYGGKGVKVCSEWEDFKVFKDWSLKNGYKDSLTIDRIDNKGDYSPDNCRFISNEAQQLNKSTNRLVTIGKVTMTVKEWCDTYNINRSCFVWRLNNGWKGKDLLKRGD